ncbi:DUF1365 domain-containing protein [Parvibaculaceae bacterium PLY_AMNH_Bact1]|nr:DUF1365 domain-containing protein [Parvibaculaceae bacterium PLY_AMNH_Bact1]
MFSSLYKGFVDHARRRPARHTLRYRVFSLLLDLDELDEINRTSRVFGINRWALLSFWEKDHGAGEDSNLKAWVAEHVTKAGFSATGMRVRVLCYPRILGYVFNPLTVYYCYDPNGVLMVTLHEVHNTFDEKHTYVLPAPVDKRGRVRQEIEKRMYVSPFTEMEGHYQFDLCPPDEHVRVFIGLSDAEGPLLSASFEGEREPWSDRALLLTFLQYPLMTLKVTVGIHYEALKLWWKKVPIIRHEPAKERITATHTSIKIGSEAAD